MPALVWLLSSASSQALRRRRIVQANGASGQCRSEGRFSKHDTDFSPTRLSASPSHPTRAAAAAALLQQRHAESNSALPKPHLLGITDEARLQLYLLQALPTGHVTTGRPGNSAHMLLRIVYATDYITDYAAEFRRCLHYENGSYNATPATMRSCHAPFRVSPLSGEVPIAVAKLPASSVARVALQEYNSRNGAAAPWRSMWPELHPLSCYRFWCGAS